MAIFEKIVGHIGHDFQCHWPYLVSKSWEHCGRSTLSRHSFLTTFCGCLNNFVSASNHNFKMNLITTVIFVDWMVYMLLLALSIYFIIESDVIQKYLNKNSDTYQTELAATEVMIPDFVFCDVGKKYFRLENPNYDITYTMLDKSNGKSMEVNDYAKYSLYYGDCFVITPTSKSFSYNHEHKISFTFNSSVKGDNLPQIKAMLTSRNNPYLFGIHHDGNIMSETISAQDLLILRVKEERTKHLSENCRKQPIMKYLSNKLVDGNGNCSSKCWPKNMKYGKDFDESLKKLPVCKDEETRKCINDRFRDLVKNADTYCNKLSYVGEINTRKIGKHKSWCSEVIYQNLQ